MERFIGNVWWMPALKLRHNQGDGSNNGAIAEKPLEGTEQILTFEDVYFAGPEGKKLICPDGLREALIDRGILREKMNKAGLPAPKWTRANSFEEASKWVLSRHHFPLAIKAATNASNGEGVFRLEGFRELSIFFDKIKTRFPNSDIIIEEWVQAKDVIEVTIAPGRDMLVSKIGLAKSLKAVTAWRLFPINLSSQHQSAVTNILKALGLSKSQQFPLLRLTIALTDQQAILLAVSGAVNRLEYHSGWCEIAGLEPIIGKTEFTNNHCSNKEARLARLQFLGRQARMPYFPTQPPANKNLKIKCYFADAHKAAALLVGSNPLDLAQQAALLARLLEEESNG